MLLDYQKKFKQGILNKDVSILRENIADFESYNPHFAIYQNNIYVSLMGVIEAAFPTVASLVGRENFKVLSHHFVKDNLPSEAQLSLYGASFPDFIENWEQVREDIPYLSDLARLDWARHYVYFEKEIAPEQGQSFQNVTPEELFDLKFQIRPTVQLLNFSYPVLDFLDMEKPEMTVLEREENYAVVVRDGQSENIICFQVDEYSFRFFHYLNQGESIGEAFMNVQEENEHFDLQHILTISLQNSIICV